jgi:hypothetical protein
MKANKVKCYVYYHLTQGGGGVGGGVWGGRVVSESNSSRKQMIYA